MISRLRVRKCFVILVLGLLDERVYRIYDLTVRYVWFWGFRVKGFIGYMISQGYASGLICFLFIAVFPVLGTLRFLLVCSRA